MSDDAAARHQPGGPVRTIELGDMDEERFAAVLHDAIDRLRDADLNFLVMGGLAITILSRPRWTHDIDLFLRPRDAVAALEILEDAGYETERTDPGWLFKAERDGIPLDLIFRSSGQLYLDDEMERRSRPIEFLDVQLPVMSPEDLLVVKAAADREHTHYHWFDAIGLIGRHTLDWDYVLDRAKTAQRHLLSFLVYADAKDVAVPGWVIRHLVDEAYGGPSRNLDRTGETERPVIEVDRIAARLRDELRSDERTADLDIQLALDDGRVILEGEVETEQRRADLREVAARVLGDRDVDNRVTVRELEAEPAVEVVR